jgi:hypothetical protein
VRTIGVTVDIGRRVEVVPMDPHFFDITIALYKQERAEGPVALVHTYSPKPGASDRIASVTRAMTVLGELELVGEGENLVCFPCRTWHEAAAKRTFLEACKVDPAGPVAARPLTAVDGATEQRVSIEPLGSGGYRVLADDVSEGTASRAPAVASGLAKLAELQASEGNVVSFPCGQDHHALIGLLLIRALNIRAALREEEMSASRGFLAPPSQQKG